MGDKIYIAQSKIKNAGRGVFAKVSIKKGELIESCPVIKIPEHDAENINKTMLVTYIYYLGKNKDQLTLVLGYGSIYNHSPRPNALYKENRKLGTIDFVAKIAIKKGEEITVNYSPESKTPLWFESR